MRFSKKDIRPDESEHDYVFRIARESLFNQIISERGLGGKLPDVTELREKVEEFERLKNGK